MAPAKKDDENLKFLYTCFQSAVKNSGKVDMKAVAAAHQINAGAASMRLTRIKKALEPASEPNEVDDGGNHPPGTGIPLDSPRTPKNKINQADLAATMKTDGSVLPVSTPTPVAKGKNKSKGKNEGKKRKLNEEEQVDGLIHRAGIEALTHVKIESQDEIDQLRDVMLQTDDEDLRAECQRKISALEASLF